jgi:hypothetical protein
VNFNLYPISIFVFQSKNTRIPLLQFPTTINSSLQPSLLCFTSHPDLPVGHEIQFSDIPAKYNVYVYQERTSDRLYDKNLSKQYRFEDRN